MKDAPINLLPLLPCPFCGSNNITPNDDAYGSLWVCCDDCGASTLECGVETPEQQWERWNKRAAILADRDRREEPLGWVNGELFYPKGCHDEPFVSANYQAVYAAPSPAIYTNQNELARVREVPNVPAKPVAEEIHSCSYYCQRPECIKAQRDALVKGMELDGSLEDVVAEPLLPRECRRCYVRCVDCPEPAEPPAAPVQEEQAAVGQVDTQGFPMLYGHKPLPPGTYLYAKPFTHPSADLRAQASPDAVDAARWRFLIDHGTDAGFALYLPAGVPPHMTVEDAIDAALKGTL